MREWSIEFSISEKRIGALLIIIGFSLFIVGIAIWFYRMNVLGISFVQSLTVDAFFSIPSIVMMIVGVILIVYSSVALMD